MEVITPRTLDEALRVKAERPDARPIAGGTDLLVELNFDRARPETILNLAEVAELKGWSRENGSVRLGAGLTYTRRCGRSSPSSCRPSRRPRARSARRRSEIAARSAATSAPRPPPGMRLPPLLVEGGEVEVASVRGWDDAGRRSCWRETERLEPTS